MISLYAQSDFTTGFHHSSNNVNKPCPDIKVLYLLAQGLEQFLSDLPKSHWIEFCENNMFF